MCAQKFTSKSSITCQTRNTYKHAYSHKHLIWQPLTCAYVDPSDLPIKFSPSTQWSRAADGRNGAICHHQSQGGHLHFLYLKDKGLQWECNYIHRNSKNLYTIIYIYLYHSYSWHICIYIYMLYTYVIDCENTYVLTYWVLSISSPQRQPWSVAEPLVVAGPCKGFPLKSESKSTHHCPPSIFFALSDSDMFLKQIRWYSSLYIEKLSSLDSYPPKKLTYRTLGKRKIIHSKVPVKGMGYLSFQEGRSPIPPHFSRQGVNSWISASPIKPWVPAPPNPSAPTRPPIHEWWSNTWRIQASLGSLTFQATRTFSWFFFELKSYLTQ